MGVIVYAAGRTSNEGLPRLEATSLIYRTFIAGYAEERLRNIRYTRCIPGSAIVSASSP